MRKYYKNTAKLLPLLIKTIRLEYKCQSWMVVFQLILPFMIYFSTKFDKSQYY